MKRFKCYLPLKRFLVGGELHWQSKKPALSSRVLGPELDKIKFWHTLAVAKAKKGQIIIKLYGIIDGL